MVEVEERKIKERKEAAHGHAGGEQKAAKDNSSKREPHGNKGPDTDKDHQKQNSKS